MGKLLLIIIDLFIIIADFTGCALNREYLGSNNSDDEPLYDSVPMEDESEQPPVQPILRHPAKPGTQQVVNHLIHL